jgi:hypothetical protein
MMRTGRLGQACAHAPEGLAASAAAPAKRRRNRRRCGFIVKAYHGTPSPGMAGEPPAAAGLAAERYGLLYRPEF